MKKLRAAALSGDQRALDRLLALAERYDFEDSADESERQLSASDQEILERFANRTIREHEARKPAGEREESEESDE